MQREYPLVVRPVPARGVDDLEERYWVRVAQPPSKALQRAILGYISDNYVLSALLLPQRMRLHPERFQLATLSQSLWLHRAAAMHEWMLFSYRPVSLSAARGLVYGSIHSEAGELIATVMQEGLISERHS